MRSPLSVLLGLLAACGGGATEAAPCPMPTPEGERAAFRAKAAELRERGPDVPVDEGATGLPPAGAGFEVRVTREGVGIGAVAGIASWSDEELERRIAETDAMQLGTLISGPDPAVVVPLNEDGTIPPDEGRLRGFLLPGLLSALQADPAFDDTEAVSLAIAPSTPFRTVAAVVYTLGQAGATDLDFLVRSRDALHVRRFGLPSFDRGIARATPLSMMVNARGVVVHGSGGALAPGCETPQTEPSQVTVPTASTGVDPAALQRCLRRALEGGADRDTVILSADPDESFEHFLHAAIAAGEVFETLLMSAGVM